MLRFILTGFIILTVAFMSAMVTGPAGLTSLSDLDTLVGKANPKFKCADLCTNAIEVCTSNGTTCANGNVGVHCGDYTVSKKNWKGCVEDANGGVDPCVNDTNDNCYIIQACKCKYAVAQGGNIVYSCDLQNGTKKQSSGAVVKSSNC